MWQTEPRSIRGSHARAKRKAADERRSLTTLIEEGLRRMVNEAPDRDDARFPGLDWRLPSTRRAADIDTNGAGRHLNPPSSKDSPSGLSREPMNSIDS
jgi:hypothetical protein